VILDADDGVAGGRQVAVRLSRLSTKVMVVAGRSTGAGVAMVTASAVPLPVLGLAPLSGTVLLGYRGTEVQPARSVMATTVSVSKLFMSVSLMRLTMNRQQVPKLEA
jgi:hypothetical protein